MNRHLDYRSHRQRALLAMLAAFCCLAASCGGHVDGASCSFFTDDICDPSVPPAAGAFVSPARTTAPVGATVTFTASTSAANATYQWMRSADGGSNYVNIDGATSASLTLVGVNLADDGALFLPVVSAPYNQIIGPQLGARLAVSSMPGVVFHDHEFRDGDWLLTVSAHPPPSGTTASAGQAASGGNPGAYRSMTNTLSRGPSSIRVFNAAAPAVYDPSVQGAIRWIDYSEDCSVASVSPSVATMQSTLLVEQGGRTYIAYLTDCDGAKWQTLPPISILSAGTLMLVAGPACAAGMACPDFSASGMPLRFGYMRNVSQPADAAEGSIVHGVDNWTVTVWRR